jgi:ferric-dicitrate binding protein FerR (iron transport regulator)
MIMERPENDKWLDEALSETIGAKKAGTDFEQWKQKHPEAVEMLTSRANRQATSPGPLKTRRMIMTSTITKLAAAAVVAIAAAVGIHQFAGSDKGNTGVGSLTQTLVAGPKNIKLADGSEVKLAQGAQIRVNDAAGKRGFEHIAGVIDVAVVKGLGEFIVTTPYGNVKALGTEFTLDMVDGVTANTQEHVQLLAVEVTEGSVEVSNAKGASILKEQQKLVVEKNQAPYNVEQDGDVPARLRQRMTAMVNAIEAGDAEAYTANYNINHLYKLVKGEVEYDSDLFGGTEADAERLRQNLRSIESVEALREAFVQSVNIKEPTKVYLRDIEVSEDGKHAKAKLLTGEVAGRIRGSFPEWHYFDNDWWQVDD